jgi:UTP--glucose-1-phosphate uridylyltransferase
MRKVKKAVIAAAGLGTRMYPVAKVIDKAMLPIGRRPVIDYIVRECLEAGVESIAIVVRKGSSQVQEYYSPHDALESLLKRKGWEQKGQVLQETLSVPDISFIEQDLEESYGTGVPALLARDFVNGEPFYFVSGDDVLIDPEGVSSLAGLGVAGNGNSAIMGLPLGIGVSADYCHLVTRRTHEGLKLTGIVEKPTNVSHSEGDKLVNISRYMFSSDFLDALADVGGNQDTGEVRITDGLANVIRSGGTVAVSVSEDISI